MTAKPKIKAVFFDRDGTLIYEKPGVYLSDPAKVRLYSTVPAALKLLAKRGFTFFIVSNQSGIGRGYFTEAQMHKVHERLCRLLKPAQIKEIAFCPHRPDQPCNCRKPATGMGEKLIKKYNVDVTRSFMVGDKQADVLFGQALGLKTVLMTTANGKRHLKKYPDLHPDKVASHMLNAAKFILQEDAHE